MGGASSKGPRTVTVENDEAAGVIEISDDVVNRLKSGIKAEREKQQQQQQQLPSSSSPDAGQLKQFIYYAEPSLTSMQVRKDKEAELRANDLYWNKRLQQLEANLKKTNIAMEKEYNDTIESVKKRFHDAPPSSQPAPCQDLKSKIIACYKKHPSETLLCAREVEEFTQCVGEHRIHQLDQQKKEEKK